MIFHTDYGQTHRTEQNHSPAAASSGETATAVSSSKARLERAATQECDDGMRKSRGFSFCPISPVIFHPRGF